jgi:hypothetical protein
MFAKRGPISPFTAGLLSIALLFMLAAFPSTSGAQDKNRELLLAAMKGNLQEVTRLLNSDSVVSAEDKKTVAPLELGREKEHNDTVDLLDADGGETAESRQIAKLADKVSRRAGELFLRLKDGKIVSRKDTPENQWDGYNDATGNANVSCTFSDFIDPWYVIGEQYFEGHGTQLINWETGARAEVYGSARFSPDKTRFLAIGYPGDSDCDAEIWKVSHSAVISEGVLEDSCHNLVRWAYASTVEILNRNQVIPGSRWMGLRGRKKRFHAT